MPAFNRHWLWIALGVTAAASLGIKNISGVIPLSLFAAAVLLAGIPPIRGLLPLPARLAVWIPSSFADRTVLTAIGCIAGSLAVLIRMHPPDTDPLFAWVRGHPDSRGILRGTVGWTLMMPEQPQRHMVLTDVTFQPDAGGPVIGGHACTLRCKPPDQPIFWGQRIEVPVILTGRISAVNLGVFSYEQWCRNRGIHVAAESRVPPKIICAGQNTVLILLDRLRSWHAETLYRCIPHSMWPWAAALWFGDRRQLDQAAVTAFTRTGTAHVLAVSGLHVGLLYASVAMLLSPLRHRRFLRTFILFIVVLGYAFMAGARGSTMRAAAMAVIFMIYDLFYREPDGITCLSLAGCLQLLQAPWLIADPGFQMSYFCVTALLVFSGSFSSKLRWIPRPFGEAAAATLSVQLFIIPLIGWHFGMVSLAGIAANLIAVPLLTVILWLLLLTAALSPVLPALAAIFAHALAVPVWMMEFSVSMFSRIPGAYLYSGRPAGISVFLWFLGAGCCAVALNSLRQKRLWVIAGVVFLTSAALCWPIRHPKPGLEVLDTGHADALLLVSPRGDSILLDGGNLQGNRNDGRDIVLPLLFARGITQLDAVVVTHPDSDHLGGLFSVVDTLRVKHVYIPPLEGFQGELAERFLQLCAKKGIPVSPVAYPQEIPFSGGILRVCHPDPEAARYFEKDNDRSLVLLAQWNERATALLTGDIETAAEYHLSRRSVRATLLKAPHHGSDTSSSLPFLQAVDPAAIVVSTARENRLPALGSEAKKRLESTGVPLWRTDLDGGLIFRPVSDGFRVIATRLEYGISLREP